MEYKRVVKIIIDIAMYLIFVALIRFGGTTCKCPFVFP